MAVIDTDGNTTTCIDFLKVAGVRAVGRYYSARAWKRLTKPEANALSEAGIKLFTIFENGGDPELSAEQGIHDAQIALRQAVQVAQPEGSAIYFAMEHLPHGYDASDLPGVKDYFHGIKQVLGGKYKIGVYSDGIVCDALLSSGACEYAWLSASTSFPGSKEFDRSGKWALAQRKIDLDWSGLSVDTNDAKSEFGAFLVSTTVPAIAAPAVARAQVPAFDAAAAATNRMAAAGRGVPTFVTPLSPTSTGIVATTMAIPMHALRIGETGPLVKAWQSFLRGQNFDVGTDGYFGDNTQAATAAFQAADGLKVDGVAGQQTFNAAIALGFQLIEEPDTDDTGSNFPPRPSFPSLQSTQQRWAIFGQYNYVPAPTRDNPEGIRILGSWEANNMVDIPIPQLGRTRIAGAPATIRFHRLATAQLQALWAEWESANLLDLILTYDGSFVPRFKHGQIYGGDEALSNHAFGSAFDINAEFNTFGSMPALVGNRGSVRKLVPIANKHGFYWGGHFGNPPDGMHFEVALLTSPVVV
jgi:peptidoglycan hydrolase-like protein with peptidoglycan-binding domain